MALRANLVVSLLLIAIVFVQGKTIIINALFWYSHLRVELVLAEELLHRGHEVYFLASGIIYKGFELPQDENFHLVILPRSAKALPGCKKAFDDNYGPFRVYDPMNNVQEAAEFLELTLCMHESRVTDLLEYIPSFLASGKRIDLFVNDGYRFDGYFAVCALGVNHVSFLPSLTPPTAFWSLDKPSSSTGYRLRDMTFSGRFWQVFVHLPSVIKTLGPYLGKYRASNERMDGFSCNDTRSGMKRAMLITTAIPGLDYPYAHHPNYQQVGGIMLKYHNNEVGVPQNFEDVALKEWIDAQHEGVIYIAFGSQFTPPPALFLSALEIFRSLAPRASILIATKRKENLGLTDEMSKDLRIESWVNQRMVLAHKNVIFFNSHCGALSVQEAIYFEKAVLCMAVNNDQLPISARVVDAGLGERVNRLMSHEEVRSNIEALMLHVDEHREVARKLNAVSRMLGGKEKAADLIELAAEVGGDFWLKNGEYGFLRKANKDLLMLLQVVVTVALFLCFYVSCFCFRRCCKKKKKVRTRKRKKG